MSYKSDVQATQSSAATVATTLNGAISATDTTITLTSATGFNSGGGIILIGGEVIEYSAVSSNDLTGCTRGFNGTTAASHVDTTAVTYLTPIATPALRLKAISIASDGGGAGVLILVSGDGVTYLNLDIPSGEILTTHIPEDGIVFPKGIYTLTSTNLSGYTLYTDLYNAPRLTSQN
jgi:hypothetical protein